MRALGLPSAMASIPSSGAINVPNLSSEAISERDQLVVPQG
jgi:hypothetical protein